VNTIPLYPLVSLCLFAIAVVVVAAQAAVRRSKVKVKSDGYVGIVGEKNTSMSNSITEYMVTYVTIRVVFAALICLGWAATLPIVGLGFLGWKIGTHHVTATQRLKDRIAAQEMENEALDKLVQSLQKTGSL
jgi:hypothetical protein